MQLANRPGPTWYLQHVQWELLLILFSLQIPSHIQLLGFKHFLMPLLLMFTSSDQWSHPAFSAYCSEINNHARERERNRLMFPFLLILTVAKSKRYKFEICYFPLKNSNKLRFAVYLAIFTLAQETIFYCSPAFLLVSILLFFFIVLLCTSQITTVCGKNEIHISTSYLFLWADSFL